MLSLEYNTVIFSYVRTYIKETARFHSNNSWHLSCYSFHIWNTDGEIKYGWGDKTRMGAFNRTKFLSTCWTEEDKPRIHFIYLILLRIQNLLKQDTQHILVARTRSLRLNLVRVWLTPAVDAV
jgi:hypothetical protein